MANRKLTDTQLVILSAAAAREGGLVLPLPKSVRVNRGTLTVVLRGLLTKELIAERPAQPDEEVWQSSDRWPATRGIETKVGTSRYTNLQQLKDYWLGSVRRLRRQHCSREVFMAAKEVHKVLDRVISNVAALLQSLGFVRRGRGFYLARNGNAALIEFQKSVTSSAVETTFTLNLGVICGVLLDADDPPIGKAKTHDAHLQVRLGDFLPGKPDKWWRINAGTDAEALSAEVSNLLVAEAVPYLARYLQSRELFALWETGKSPGLTEKQRVRFLARSIASEPTSGRS